MRRPFLHIAFVLALCAGVSWAPREGQADSLRLMTDLQYDLGETRTTDKATKLKEDVERREFSQIYNLEILKEILPTLSLSAGGLFDQERLWTETDTDVTVDSRSKETAIRPYLELAFRTPLLRLTTGYRKSEVKQSRTGMITEQFFTEEYSARLNWEPVDLPEVDFDFTRNSLYDEPLTSEVQTDTWQFRSRYRYRDYQFNYDHTTSDMDNLTTDFNTLTNSDNASVRFSRQYAQGRVSLNSGLRGRRQQVNFSGTGVRLIDAASPGTPFGTLPDDSPETSDPDAGFNLGGVDLLLDLTAIARTFSFGLDFDLPTTVDTLLVEFDDLNGHDIGEFPWRVLVRDNDTDLWRELPLTQRRTNLPENRFELSFPQTRTRFIKVVTRQILVDGEDLVIRRLTAQRTLPEDAAEFVTTDWTADTTVSWKMSERTTTGYDLLYREERSKPFDDWRSVLNTGVRLRHQFNDVFTGNVQGQRSEIRENDGGGSLGYTASASLAAKFLDTFDQSLTYSYSRQNDNESGTSISNSVFLRSNLDLYEGLSLFLDNGQSWQSPAEGAASQSTFVRLGSNIIPNRWMNFTLTYGVIWDDEENEPRSRDQNGRLVATWSPFQSLSLSADLSFTDDDGRVKDSTTEQQYFVNWSPFRNGTLQFSLAYGESKTSEMESVQVLSPTLRWQINRVTMLTLDYSRGNREDETEIIDFESVGLGLRFFF